MCVIVNAIRTLYMYRNQGNIRGVCARVCPWVGGGCVCVRARVCVCVDRLAVR